jgi:hypothetical protein
MTMETSVIPALRAAVEAVGMGFSQASAGRVEVIDNGRERFFSVATDMVREWSSATYVESIASAPCTRANRVEVFKEMLARPVNNV